MTPWKMAAAVLLLPLLQSASPSEQIIVNRVDAHNGEALALLERVVNVNSGTQNFAGVRQVGRIFSDELESIGFETRWVDGAAWQRAGHLVAEHPARGIHILLIGHLDTVFERDSPFQRFDRIDAQRARGPGIIDMKGGDVILVHALKALAEAGVLSGLHVTVVMTGDEEAPGRPLALARAALVDAAKGADAAIGFEDGPGDPRYGVTARRGTTSWRLRVTATAAHSSQIFRPDVGVGAIFEAARILDQFRERLAGQPHLTLNPGLIVGGTSADFDAAQARGSASGKTNVVAEQSIVSGDLRTLSPDQRDRAKEIMHTIVRRALPRTTATLTFDDGYPPLPPSEGNARLLALYDRVSRDLGFGAVTAASPDAAGAADVAFVAGEAKMVLDGVGLMGRDDHTSRETADLTTLASQTKRAAVLLYRLGRGEY